MDQAIAVRLRQFFAKNASLSLILILGVVLMLLPISGKKDGSSHEEITTAAPAAEPLQEQLASILSRVEGAGKVQVLLTEQTGERINYQTDSNSAGTDTVITTDSSRNQTGLITQIDPPRFLGAIVLCQGADNPNVRLDLTQAVSNATGLGFNKITILKMK